MSMSIGALAASTGETVKTLRFWTDQGLLGAERGENGYRLYGQEAPGQVRFIREAQRLELSLRVIRRLLDLARQDAHPCPEVEGQLSAQLQMVRARMAALRAVEARLKMMLTDAQRHPCGEGGCRFLPAEGA